MEKPLQTISLATFIGLLLSIVYNIGYFSKIDWALLSILSIEDHISSGIAFLPITIALLVASMCAGVLNNNKHHENNKGSETNQENQLISFIKEDSLIVTIVFGLYFVALPYNDPFLIIVILLGLFPLLFLTAIRKILLSFSIGFKPQTARLTFLITGLFLMTFYMGGLKSSSDLSKQKSDFQHTITIEGGTQRVQILRYFGNGFLANMDDELVILHQDRVIKIRNDYRSNHKPTLSCLIGVICLEGNTKSENQENDSE